MCTCASTSSNRRRKWYNVRLNVSLVRQINRHAMFPNMSRDTGGRERRRKGKAMIKMCPILSATFKFKCRASSSRLQQLQLGYATEANCASAGILWNMLVASEPRGQCKGRISDPCFNFAPLTTTRFSYYFNNFTGPCWMGVEDNGCWILQNA